MLFVDDDTNYHVLRLPQDAAMWYLVNAFLKLRKQVFVDHKKWDLDTHEDLEFEQYDHLGTTYLIAEDRNTGEILGGARLLRTDTPSGSGSTRQIDYSYMIRDAVLGLLPGLPRGICQGTPPRDANIWEVTRMLSLGRTGVAEGMIHTVNQYLNAMGARTCLFLGSPAFFRMGRKLGYAPRMLGNIAGNESGRFVAFECDVIADHSFGEQHKGTKAPVDLTIADHGVAKSHHLTDEDVIAATTYEWPKTGKVVTVWFETVRPQDCRVIETQGYEKCFA
ncbi:MAG: acyl-homoserine-lactone synthase [Albidovulum sp.]|uniref:acyl-homoserine-lactone synthase n=1 Tax=Albidovulum sp. TaxID=1872424 RepID=UPI003CA3E3FC